MAEHTSFRIGGPADLLARPRNEAELTALLAIAARRETPVFLMGNGTNLLVSDAGIRGLVVKTGNLSRIERVGETGLRAESGATLAQLAGTALDCHLAGLAFAHGIPGTVGGAVVMNAGAYRGEIRDVAVETRCCDRWGAPSLLRGGAHEFGYRRSAFAAKPDLLALSTLFLLTPGDPVEIRGEMDEYARRRRQSQPLEYPSAGSVFKRPPGRFAGPLIQSCGLKGFAVGGAQVSEKHAGFIINRGGATCDDVRRLIDHIQRTVLAREGVALEPEVRFVGQA
jgi:UDP-N-acetylmuramate dehydrogenase